MQRCNFPQASTKMPISSSQSGSNRSLFLGHRCLTALKGVHAAVWCCWFYEHALDREEGFLADAVGKSSQQKKHLQPPPKIRTHRMSDRLLVEPALCVVLHQTSIMLHHKSLARVQVRYITWSFMSKSLPGNSAPKNLVGCWNQVELKCIWSIFHHKVHLDRHASFTAAGRRLETRSWRRNSRRWGSWTPATPMMFFHMFHDLHCISA